jgi:hypothetical protein
MVSLGHVAVDSDHQVIVAVGVSNQPPDVEHLEPMLQRIGASAGRHGQSLGWR